MDVLKDKRFSGVVKDPRFKKIPRKHVKTEVDKRFHGMFSGKQFEQKYLVNKRGSPLDHKVSEDFQKFYHLSENEQDAKAENTTSDEEGDGDCKKINQDEESDNRTEDAKINFTLIGAEPQASSDEDGSTSTDTEFTEGEEEEEIDHCWHELDADAPRSSSVTRRLALCNMDWDRLRAEDFLVVFNSFKPPDGVINSIKIYPSEFGLERMKKEKLKGPAELIEEKLNSDEDDPSSKSKGCNFHQEKLRQYQINRLKYFFAVVDCDSAKTADTLYDQLNGIQFESSGCILDLRFIPDDMTFEQEPVSVANSLACPSDYKPTFFITSALNQVKVDLTWDETDPRRKEVLEKAFTDPESIENDLKEYLASPSESEDETGEVEDTANSYKLNSKEAIAKYRALLQSLEDKEKPDEEEFDMEITWESGLKEKTEKLVKEKALNENLTPFEEKLQKKKDLKKHKKEKKLKPMNEDDDDNFSEEFELGDSGDNEQERRVTSKGRKKNNSKLQEDSEVDENKLAELALLVAEPDEKNSSDSDYPNDEQKAKKKRKKKIKQKEKKEDPVVDYIDDPRFAAIYTSHLFHIDPSDPKFKEKKKQQASVEATQREKHNVFSPLIASHEISKEEVDCVGGLNAEAQKSVKIEALKKKLTPLCKKFQKKNRLRKLEGHRDGTIQKEEDSTFMADISADTTVDVDCSRKRKKRQVIEKQSSSSERDSTFVTDSSPDVSHLKRKKKLQKLKKQGFLVDDFNSQQSSNNAELLNGSTSSATYFGDDDDSGILIFSSGSTEKQTSKFSSETPHHVNSVQKKSKKYHVS